MTSVQVPDLTDIREGLSLRRQARVVAGEWCQRHAASACLLVPLLVLVGAVHAIGMWSFPRWVDDPGTYLSQAWSLQYRHALSPYSYIYDHAPAGWIQLSLWSMLTNGFNRHDSAIGFGNECMLIAKLASCALLFALGRRLQFSRLGAAGAVLLFGLCPLELMYGRWTFLDNLVTPWLLLAFVLVASPRRSISAATGAALSFAIAALTKETALVVLPALLWAMVQNLDRRNRAYVIAVAGFSGLLLMAMYPLYALYKGELLERPGQNSLLGTAKWQLVGRESSGSLLDPSSPTAHMVGQWLGIDRWLLLAGLVAIPIALLARRLRPAVLVLVLQWLVLVRGGYVPFMHVVNLMPWSALVAVGAVEVVAGNRRLATFRRLAGGRRAGRPLPRRRAAATGLAAVCLAAVLVGSWTPTLGHMLHARQEPPLWSATQWLADNVPRDRVLVVHDSIWTDLVHHYGFDPQPIIVYKLDTDPAVREKLRRIDYLILPNWYYATPAGVAKYPTVTEARKHAVAVARFGSGDDGVQVYRVSRYWRPGYTMRTPGREALGRLLHAVMVVAVMVALAGACANTPDTTLHPDPPAVTYAPLQHPFRGARLLVDDQTAGARWQRQRGAGWLDPITTRPQARWLNGPQDLAGLPALAARARRQRALLVLVAYYVPNRGCSSSSGEGAPTSRQYRRWIERLIHHLGSTRAAIVVEPDAVAADCFDTRRATLLKRSVKRLADAGQYVYIDAGHARWRSTGEMAQRLLAAGIQDAQGFSVNVANRQTTKQSYQWGRELSDLLGRREFVVDTSRNGLGPPPDDPERDDEWCNPRRQGLGHPPTTRTSMPGLAALLWIKRPGESDGICGGETTYLFSPTQARRLLVNSPFVPAASRRLATAADVPPTADGHDRT